MTLAELVARYRVAANDLEVPGFCSDEEVLDYLNEAQGEAASITAVAEATAHAIERVAAAIRQPGGEQAVQLKVAEKAVEAYGKVAADATTTLIVPSNMGEVSALIASAMKMVQSSQPPR